MKIRVVLNTGQTGTIDDAEFNPASMKKIGDTQPTQSQPEQQVRQSLLQGNLSSPDVLSGNDLVSNIVNTVSRPFVKTGQTIAGTGYEAARAVATANLAKDASKPKNKQQQAKFDKKYAQTQQADPFINTDDFSNGNTKGLVDQAKNSASIASYAIPFGKGANILTKAVLPGAAVGAAQELPDAKNVEDVAKAGIEGGATAGILHGAGKAIEGVSKLAGGKAADVVENVGKKAAIKGLKPSPSQQANFFKETGEKLDNFMVDRGLAGADYEKIDKHIAPLQDQFDQVASNPHITIDTKDVTNGFNKQITRLNDSILPADKAKAKVLENIRDNFTSKFGEGHQTAENITNLRRDIDAGIKDFSMDPAVKGPLNITRDVLQTSLRDTADKAGIKVAGKSLKDLGIELSKLYKLQDIAERQHFNGKGSLPFGITQLLGAGVGGGVAGLPGIATGLAATAVGNSPKVSQMAAEGLIGTADRMRGIPSIPGGVGQAVNQGAVRLPSLIENNSQPNQNEQPNQSGQTLPPMDQSVPQQDTAVNQPSYITGHSPEELYQAYLKAQAAGDKVNTTALRQMYTDETTYQANQAKLQPGAKKPLSGPNSVLYNKAQTAVKSLDRIENVLKSDPNALVNKLNPLDQQGRQIGSDITSAIDLLGYFRTGATINPEQRKDYIYLFPGLGDDEKTKAIKIQRLKDEFQGYIDGLANSGSAGDTTGTQTNSVMLPSM